MSKEGAVSLLCLNTYLIPALFVDKGNASCKQQTARATGIGKLIAGSAGRQASTRRSPASSPPPAQDATSSSSSTHGGGADESSLASTKSGAPYDVILLQEVWGSSMSQLEAPLKEFDVIPYCKSWGFSVLDTALQYANRRGGLWVAGKRETTKCLYTNWMTYGMSNTSSKKGAVATLFQFPKARGSLAEIERTAKDRADRRRDRGDNDGNNLSSEDLPEVFSESKELMGCGTLRYLLTINTHVDPTNDNRMIERQIDQLCSWISKDVIQDKKFLGLFEEEQNMNKFDFIARHVGFVVCGDWNSPTKFVTTAMSGLDVVDLYDDCWGRVKGGLSTTVVGALSSMMGGGPTNRRDEATYDGSKNSLVMWKGEKARIDIQFGVNKVTIPNSSATVHFAPLEAQDAEILHYPQGAELSDHYPVRLQLRKRASSQ